MSAWAKPGVKCVCVDDRPHGRADYYSVLPVKGQVYTITRVEWYRWADGRDGVGVHLAEIKRPVPEGLGMAAPWGLTRFRPLISQDDDVALFRHHLLPQEVDA